MLRVRLAAFNVRTILWATVCYHASLSIAVTSMISFDSLLRPRRYYDSMTARLRLLRDCLV